MKLTLVIEKYSIGLNLSCFARAHRPALNPIALTVAFSVSSFSHDLLPFFLELLRVLAFNPALKHLVSCVKFVEAVTDVIGSVKVKPHFPSL